MSLPDSPPAAGIDDPPPVPRPVLDSLTGYRRPRLRADVPVMWRTDSTIQIGEDVIVDRVTRSHVAWLASLDGLSTPAAITESLTIPEPEADRLVRALRAANALEDASRIPAPLRWIPQPERDVAAARHAAAVQTYGDAELATRATVARDACRVRVLGSGGVADEIDRAILAAGFTRDDAHPTVIVLATTPHPDVPLGLGEVPPDLPHLPIGVHGARAVVGPIVVPGVTSCLRCAHLHRRDADPAWPVIAVQWAQAMRDLPIPPRDPLLTRLAADHAALLLRSWTDAPELTQCWSGTAVEIRLPGGEATRRTRAPHPLCGCLWPVE